MKPGTKVSGIFSIKQIIVKPFQNRGQTTFYCTINKNMVYPLFLFKICLMLHLETIMTTMGK